MMISNGDRIWPLFTMLEIRALKEDYLILYNSEIC